MSDDRNDELELEEELTETEEPKAEKKGKVSKSDAGKGKKKVHKRNRVVRYFREMRSELKKVVWPTPKQVVNNTLVAMVVIFAAAIVVWGVDQVSAQIINALRTIALPAADLPVSTPTPAATATVLVRGLLGMLGL
jgi:preprotein translocase subunit SecE